MKSGVKLVRMPFVKLLNKCFTEKMRLIKGVYEELNKESPDFIFLHDFSTASVRQIRKYIMKNPQVTMVADCHTAFTNSGKSLVSLRILHGIIYKRFGHMILDYAKRIYYVGPETKRFLTQIYKFPESKLAYLPLGGNILSDNEYNRIRRKVRNEYDINEDEIVFLHSGKLDEAKKTVDIIRCFKNRKNKQSNAELYIIGDTENKERKKEIVELSSDDNKIHMLGWKSGHDLYEFLWSSDVYLQPGTPSATLQLAACNRCAVVVNDYECYQNLFDSKETRVTSLEELQNAIDSFSESKERVETVKQYCYKIATQYLDYEKQSMDILSNK